MRYIETGASPRSLAELGLTVGLAPPDFLLLCELPDSTDSMIFVHDIREKLQARFGPNASHYELTFSTTRHRIVRRLAIDPDDLVLALARETVRSLQGEQDSNLFPLIGGDDEDRVHHCWRRLPLGERAVLVEQHGLDVAAMLETDCPDELLHAMQWRVEA